MKKITLLTLVMLLLASTASAVPTMMNLGPYKLSFDLDTATNYTAQIQEPISSTTYTGVDYVDYSILINCGDNEAQINMTDYYSPVPASDEVTKSMSRKITREMACMNIETREQLINRHSGFLTTCEDLSGKSIFQASYWLDRYFTSGDYVGQNSCRITSDLPWKTTNSLLTTIHVEKIDDV
ncbi:MAG: hypothetical protein ACXQT4_01400 [Methanotrichaceae archaeon]